jgi:ABC-type polysaccharide/polyol phosphate transport system ATPase subunit
MLEEHSIVIKNLSKTYDLHKRRSDRLIDSIQLYRRKNKNTVQALRNISLTIRKGEVLGIKGPNGSGKSTLIKILAGVTRPTSGSVEIFGTVAPLLEVGTGFHPDLTGKENVFLNGSILGMKRKMIKSIYPKIIKFSELEAYEDVPIKFYSSGMQMRLAFSVAIHLDTDIILLDEVLAVGDQSFREKCIRKIKDLSHSNKTIVVVSHNHKMLDLLCSSKFYIEKGEIK